MSRIGVLIVDDSAVVRDVLCGIFESAAGIEVIGAAADPIFAQRYLDKKWPDVIILDIEMPRMDGLTFLSNIMRQRPTPVVICSSLVDAGAEITMKALEQGAVEIITKPKMGVKGYLSEQKSALLDVVRAAANANLAKWTRIARSNESKTVPATAPVKAGNRPAPSGQPPQKNTADVVLAPPG
ncbi:MAG: response regulator, partial [Gammaproteobacteria bacterium]|nr:response regulator [Gammaproteobacteria bacterium]